MPEFLSNALESSGSLALLDLIIVFYLVYVLLLLVRGTRTVPMALGLLLLVILYLVSRYLSLATTYMLLDQLMDVAVIFALIIFHHYYEENQTIGITSGSTVLLDRNPLLPTALP